MSLCGWCGRPCRCPQFPWKRNGLIPQACELNAYAQILEADIKKLKEKIEELE